MRSASETGKGPSGPFLAWVGRGIDALDWSGRLIAVLCLLAMFVLLFINVVLRYSLGEGIPWAYEIHAVFLPWLVAGGVVVAAARGRNISVTVLPNLLGPRGQRVLPLAVQIAVLIICINVLWSSQPILKASTFQTLATLGIKQVWGYASLVYGFGCMALIAALESVRLLMGGHANGPQTSLS